MEKKIGNYLFSKSVNLNIYVFLFMLVDDGFYPEPTKSQES